ncbi:MAG: FeoA family protein [Candidatus Limnocylindrales bacterium]
MSSAQGREMGRRNSEESTGHEAMQIELADLPAGAHGVVSGLRGGTGFLSRMTALGFTVGAPIRVMQNYGRGPLIALVRDSRIALGRREAGRVLVQAALSAAPDENEDTAAEVQEPA